MKAESVYKQNFPKYKKKALYVSILKQEMRSEVKHNQRLEKDIGNQSRMLKRRRNGTVEKQVAFLCLFLLLNALTKYIGFNLLSNFQTTN